MLTSQTGTRVSIYPKYLGLTDIALAHLEFYTYVL